MEIWLIYPYGNIPGEGRRQDRPEMIGSTLAEAGHNVVWWASSFDHASKKQRANRPKNIKLGSNFEIRLVPTIGYTRNISILRVISEKIYARNVLKASRNVKAPDCIILSEPALFRGSPILSIVDQHKSFLIIDMLDQWPELFEIALPKLMRRFASIIFYPFYRFRRKVFSRANGIITVSKSYLDLTKEIVPEHSEDLKKIIYFGTDVSLFRRQMASSSNKPDNSFSLPMKSDGNVWVVLASTLGANYDLPTLIEVVKRIEKSDLDVTIYVAGDGPMKSVLTDYIRKSNPTRLVYLGNPSAEELALAYGEFDVGLSMYVAGSSVTMPVKAFHYFAAGLPIVNSLKGDLAGLIEQEFCGFNYVAEDEDSLFFALQRIVLEHATRKKMATNAHALAMRFDIKTQYEQVLDLVADIGAAK